MSRDVIEVTSECFAGNHSMCTEQIHKGRCECECHQQFENDATKARRYDWLQSQMDNITYHRKQLVVHIKCGRTLDEFIDSKINEGGAK